MKSIIKRWIGIILAIAMIVGSYSSGIYAKEMDSSESSGEILKESEYIEGEEADLNGSLFEEKEQQEGEDSSIEEVELESEEEVVVPHIAYQVHVQNIGWQDWKKDGEIAGTEGQSLRLEAIRVKVTDENGEVLPNYSVQYRVHVQLLGWQDWKKDGEMAGTEGQSLRLEAIEVKLIDLNAPEKECELTYRSHVANLGWLSYVYQGQLSGSEGLGFRLEAIQMRLSGAVEDGRGYVSGLKNTDLLMSAHVQNIGDCEKDPATGMLGTVGSSLRMEAVCLNLNNKENNKLAGDIEYQAHVQNIGWQDWKKDGEMAGTSGQSLRVEAFKIRLTGDAGKYFDIYYRAHVEKLGWLGWAKNGQEAGSQGYSYRMEALEVKVVLKGEPAPGSMYRAFVDQSELFRLIRAYEGCRYVYGGTTPSGWDCSGCVQWLYRNILGKSIPRTSREQSRIGTAVSCWDDSSWRPGDILIFGNGSPSHVGLYIGNGEMIHALNSRKGTRIDNVRWYDRVDTELRLLTVRRVQ